MSRRSTESNESEAWISVLTAAAQLCVSRFTVYRLLDDQALTGRWVRGRRQVEATSITDYLARQTTNATGSQG